VHFLTKFLVIIAAVLSVLLAGLSVGMAVNAQEVAQENQALDSELAAAKSSVSQREGEAIAQAESLLADQAELIDQRAEAQQQAARLRSEVNRLNQQLIESTQAQRTFEAELAGLRSVFEQLIAIDDERADELRGLRDKQVEAAYRQLELTDQIQELSAQLEVARETGRALQEELQLLREQQDTRMASGGANGDRNRGVRLAPQNFRGRVTSIDSNPAGGTLVGINAGSQDQLAPRMELRVVRGNTFVATLVVRDVNLNDAVAVVDVEGPGAPVRSGDIIEPAAR
jgi:hypothetical protein